MSVCEQEVFTSKKKNCSTPFPIGGKMHHTNQSQNYKANHMIRLLRYSCGKDSGERVRATMTVIETTIVIVSFES